MSMTRRKYDEAAFFCGKVEQSEGAEFRYYLSAFLSAARSITFVFKKENKGDEGFDEYYENMRRLLAEDDALADVMLELRNHALKREVIKPAGKDRFRTAIVEQASELPYHKGNLPSVGGHYRVVHELEIPDEVRDRLPEETIKKFETEYSGHYVEDLCLAYLSSLYVFVHTWESMPSY